MNWHHHTGTFKPASPAKIIGFTALLLLALFALAAALEVPQLRGRVNDYAGIVRTEHAHALERALAQFEQKTGHQVAVLTVPSLDGEDIEGFAIRVAENWKIGHKGFDNGAILIVASRDRKLRIEVGYGLEGVLPDATASTIIRNVIVPRFRANDFSGGVVAGVDAIMKVTSGEPMPEATRRRTSSQSSGLSSLMPFLILLALIMIFGPFAGLVPRRSGDRWMTHGRRHHPFGWGGGGFGGGFGGGGGGFSGGGGGFGGGGASGSW